MPNIRVDTLTTIILTHYFTGTFICPFFILTANKSLILSTEIVPSGCSILSHMRNAQLFLLSHLGCDAEYTASFIRTVSLASVLTWQRALSTWSPWCDSL